MRQDYNSFEGFEVWFHRLQMRSKMILFISLIILILYTPFFMFLAKKFLLSYQDVANFKPFLQSMFYDFFEPTKKLQVVFCKENVCKKGFADAADVFITFKQHYWGLMYKLLFKFLIGYIFFWIPCIILFLKKFGREAHKLHQEKIKRGIKIQSEKSLKKQLKKKYGRRDKDLSLSKNLCLPYQLENRHVFIVGSTGTGKTTLLKNVLLKLRERNEKAIVFDIKGDYLSCFYDKEKDYILNPLDLRCANWNIFNDLKTDKLAYSFAASIIPEGFGENKYFNDAARDLFSDILCVLRRQKATNRDVWNVINSSAAEIYETIKDFDGVGKAHIQKLDSNQTAGIISTLAQYTRIFKELANINGDFSLKNWLKYNNGFLFLTVPPNHLELLKPFISAVINILITEILSFPDDQNRRVFFIIDELGALQKIPAITNGLTLGRSKGLSFWVGIQDFGKIDQKYSRSIRETLWNNCITKIIFRTDAPDTCQYLAQAIGQAEIEESKKSHSMGVEDNRDGLSIARHTLVKYALLPSQIQQIPDLTAIVKILNFEPAYPCQIEIPDIQSSVPGFIEVEEEMEKFQEEGQEIKEEPASQEEEQGHTEQEAQLAPPDNLNWLLETRKEEKQQLVNGLNDKKDKKEDEVNLWE